MTLLGLKWAQDLNNRAAHPHEEFSGVPPPPGFASNLSDYIVGGLVERGGGYLFERGEG